MKYKIYATKYADIDAILNSLPIAKDYLKAFNVEFSELNELEQKENKQSLFERALTFASFGWVKIKSVKSDYLSSLDTTGYDGVILFLDKSKAKEEAKLHGEHTAKDGKSLMEVYVTYGYTSFSISRIRDKYQESYKGVKQDGLLDSTTHALVHELYHSLSYLNNIPDQLHAFIEENLWKDYDEYLLKALTPPDSNSLKLFNMARSLLGTDVTPKDLVPDNVACAETVNAIHMKIFGDPIGGGASTYNMYRALLARKDFKRVDVPQKGDIIISPTGYSTKPSTIVTNGHVGILGEKDIMSNSSFTGLFTANYTLDSWNRRYAGLGGFPVVLFRKLG